MKTMTQSIEKKRSLNCVKSGPPKSSLLRWKLNHFTG